MKKIHIVGAFDRHNYGDILFPLIHTEFIKQNLNASEVDIRYYSISESDLTKCGGLKTYSTKQLLSKRLSCDETIIMSGGDILAVGWSVMIGQISTPFVYFFTRVASRILPFKTLNSGIKKIYSHLNEFPYIISKHNTTAKIYYTCVGGVNFSPNNNNYHIKAVCDELKTVESISVRDINTQAKLASNDIESRLVPDCALVMSDFYTKEKLGERNWLLHVDKTESFSDKNFIVFQSGKNYIKSKIDYVVEQLTDIQNKTGMSILLLPIGRATGHEDDVVLKRVYDRLKENKCAVGLQNSEHIFDIMASLAFGKCYIGTSLHGAITAYSFGNKSCGFSTNKVKKLSAFMSSWMSQGDFSICENQDFRSNFLEMIENGTSITGSETLIEQKQMIYRELNRYI